MSNCDKCGLPEELCICESIAKEAQKIVVKTEKKKFGKVYTVIEGIDEKEIDLKNLASELKSKFACGGTSKNGKVELQGNHVMKTKDELMKIGFASEAIEVQR
jgi:translation initiation factor 1